MSDKPKRKFWQIHKTTTFVVVVVALGLPILTIVSVSMEKADQISYAEDDSGKILCVMIFAYVSMLTAVAFLCEWLIRRREARKL
jgi:hypothetical protein